MIAQADVRRLPLAAESVDMIFTDPPYVKDLVHTYRWLAQEARRVLKPGGFLAAMCGGIALNEIMRWFDDAGLTFYWLYQMGLSSRGASVVWIRGNTKVPITTRTKHVLVYSKGLSLSRSATVGLYWAGGADKVYHHWGQDIDSHRYYIDCFSGPGDLVLDPMCGGGTTAAACELLGRRWLCFDIDPAALVTTQKRINGDGIPLDPLPLFGSAHGLPA